MGARYPIHSDARPPRVAQGPEMRPTPQISGASTFHGRIRPIPHGCGSQILIRGRGPRQADCHSAFCISGYLFGRYRDLNVPIVTADPPVLLLSAPGIVSPGYAGTF